MLIDRIPYRVDIEQETCRIAFFSTCDPLAICDGDFEYDNDDDYVGARLRVRLQMMVSKGGEVGGKVGSHSYIKEIKDCLLSHLDFASLSLVACLWIT